MKMSFSRLRRLLSGTLQLSARGFPFHLSGKKQAAGSFRAWFFAFSLLLMLGTFIYLFDFWGNPRPARFFGLPFVFTFPLLAILSAKNLDSLDEKPESKASPTTGKTPEPILLVFARRAFHCASQENLFDEISNHLREEFGITKFCLYGNHAENTEFKPFFISEGCAPPEIYGILPSGKTLLAWSESFGSLVSVQGFLGAEDDDSIEAILMLKERRIGFLLPVRLHGKPEYIFLLGPSAVQAPLDSSDKARLEIYLRIAVMALENKSLLDENETVRKRLLATDKMVSVGTLAAGLAHEIRNPIVSIKTFVQLLPEKLQDEEFRTQFLEIVNGEILRICNLVDSLLDYARPGKPNFRYEDINKIILVMLPLLESLAKEKGVRIVTNLEDDLPRVRLDTEQIKQVILNVLLNAIEASSFMGKVFVQTLRVPSHDEKTQNQYVQVLVKDEGSGISSQTLERIFDPFFTTKPGGSGLGLAIANQIVLEHQGFIDVESSEGKGSSFFVNLPSEPPDPSTKTIE